MKRPIFKPTKFEMECLGIFHRIVKSVMFNIIMLILGFVLGFGSVICHIRYSTSISSKHKYIEKIETTLDDINKFNEQYEKKCDDIKNILIDLEIKLSQDD